MSNLRNAYELKLMRESGKISALALKRALESAKLGVKEIEVDKEAEKAIYKAGGDLSYKTVPGYDFATCVTVNEQVVHGIPTDREIEEGDLVSVDLAASYKGWHTDTAWTVMVGKGDAEKKKFLQTGEDALWKGVKQAVAGNRIGDIGAAIQSRVEGAGYSVVKSLVGHGVGRELHEDPEVPGYGKKGTGVLLKEGMTLAIEVIYNQGSEDVILGSDGWTFLTADGSLAALFEMTVVVGKEKAEVLTDWRVA
jgi:methionyl aminopeptidase